MPCSFKAQNPTVGAVVPSFGFILMYPQTQLQTLRPLPYTANPAPLEPGAETSIPWGSLI